MRRRDGDRARECLGTAVRRDDGPRPYRSLSPACLPRPERSSRSPLRAPSPGSRRWLAGDWDVAEAWPYVLAGLLAPGISQILFTFAVRDAGASRTSVTVGTAPLFAVATALIFLDEPLVAGLILGAALIVTGGIVLASDRARPEHFKRIGLVYALIGTVAFATGTRSSAGSGPTSPTPSPASPHSWPCSPGPR